MSFYSFRQNNSGGSFRIDHDRGISILVVVEADKHSHAVADAEEIGLYFDGVGDCPCCGFRWSAWNDEPYEVPMSYDEELTVVSVGEEFYKGYPKTFAYVHYKDGRVVGYEEPKDNY